MNSIGRNGIEIIKAYLIDPIGVENTEVRTTTTNTFLSNRSKVALKFELSHTLIGGFGAHNT